MNSIVVYGSHFGNTRKVAGAIATALQTHGEVQLLSAEEAPSTFPVDIDLVIVGGPTEGFRMTPPVARFLDRLEAQAVKGVAAAAFDTRIRPHWWLLGYAAPGIARRLRGMGARVIAEPEGFFVEGAIDERNGRYPVLAAGELERATSWAASLASIVEARTPALI